MNADLNLDQARQLESLVAHLIDGQLSDDQWEQLVALLHIPAARQHYRATMAIHAQLLWLASPATHQPISADRFQEVA